MSKPMHLCNHPGCMALIPFDQRYCDKHEYRKPISCADKEQRHLMNKATYYKRTHSDREGKYQLFYRSTQWRKLSHHWLMLHPFCASCEAQGRMRKGDVVDHITEIRDDWSKRLDTNNLQTLCYACHNRKTWKQKQARKKRRESQTDSSQR